jgi:hypothetical protein
MIEGMQMRWARLGQGSNNSINQSANQVFKHGTNSKVPTYLPKVPYTKDIPKYRIGGMIKY